MPHSLLAFLCSLIVTSASGISNSTGRKKSLTPPQQVCSLFARGLQLGCDGASIWLWGGPFGSLSRVPWPVNVQHILTLESSGSWLRSCRQALTGWLETGSSETERHHRGSLGRLMDRNRARGFLNASSTQEHLNSGFMQMSCHLLRQGGCTL